MTHVTDPNKYWINQIQKLGEHVFNLLEIEDAKVRPDSDGNGFLGRVNRYKSRSDLYIFVGLSLFDQSFFHFSSSSSRRETTRVFLFEFQFQGFGFWVSDPTKSVLMGLAHLGFIYEAQWAYDKYGNNTRLQAHFLWSPTKKWQENNAMFGCRVVSIVK